MNKGDKKFEVIFVDKNGLSIIKIVDNKFINESDIMSRYIRNMFNVRLITISYDSEKDDINKIMSEPIMFDNFYKKRLNEINPLLERTFYDNMY